MIWHTHMLNPRAFLEDTMLAGIRKFWATGMPWDLVNRAIDNNFNYTVSAECKARWAEATNLCWKNVDDLSAKTLKCPKCGSVVNIPWTTCQFPEVYDGEPPSLDGNGYGDSNLQYTCQDCGLLIQKEFLSVAKFVDDYKALLASPHRPMPGTLLDPKTGTPTKPPVENKKVKTTHTFPNRLLRSDCNGISTRITGLATWCTYLKPTMHQVRNEIEGVLADRRQVRKIEVVPRTSSYMLPVESRLAVRKMMSRYWENFGPFALDLSGAVMRQGVFVEKMCQLDWLHSPSATDTMARLITKYNRFIQIMKRNPSEVAVPTLDVDLAWHTHQLSPSRYYRHSLINTARFIDHDDKIDEGTLSKQFEWTSKVYQESYGEVYSECTCWYCEGMSALSFIPLVTLLIKPNHLSHPLHAHQHRRQSARPVHTGEE